jgi:hypothetical protein
MIPQELDMIRAGFFGYVVRNSSLVENKNAVFPALNVLSNPLLFSPVDEFLVGSEFAW